MLCMLRGPWNEQSDGGGLQVLSEAYNWSFSTDSKMNCFSDGDFEFWIPS